RALAQMLGITWYPRQLRSVFGRFQRLFELSGALVAVAEPLSGTEKLSGNYLTALFTATWKNLRDDAVAMKADVLLYMLLRHAALLEYKAASFRILLRRGLITADALLDPDLADAGTRTPWTQLATGVTGLTPMAVGDYLDSIKVQL